MKELSASTCPDQEIQAVLEHIHRTWGEIESLNEIVTLMCDEAADLTRSLVEPERLQDEVGALLAHRLNALGAANVSSSCEADAACRLFAFINEHARGYDELQTAVSEVKTFSAACDGLLEYLTDTFPGFAKAQPKDFMAAKASKSSWEALERKYNPLAAAKRFKGTVILTGRDDWLVTRTSTLSALWQEHDKGMPPHATLLYAVLRHFCEIYEFLQPYRIHEELQAWAAALPPTPQGTAPALEHPVLQVFVLAQQLFATSVLARTSRSEAASWALMHAYAKAITYRGAEVPEDVLQAIDAEYGVC